MKRTRSSHLLALCSLFFAWSTSQISVHAQPAQAQPAQHNAPGTFSVALKLPDHFTAYASESVGHRRCVSGTSTDGDGMNQRPAVYATNASGKRVLWVARLDLPANMYQSRATHCTGRGDALFVLLQSDTQASQSLSQTLLRVVKLDAITGAVQLQQDVEVPATHSAWVDKGATRFVWEGNRLVIAGNARLASDHERLQKFTMRLSDDLEPAADEANATDLRTSYGKCIDAANGVTPVMQSCMDVEHAYQDKRLNAAYKKLMALLDKHKQAELRANERTWLAYRKSHCASDPDAGQADALSSFDCSILETAKQAAALESRSSTERLKQ